MTSRVVPLVEICVDDVAGAIDAEAAGADRIELCAALSEGGITPSLGQVATILRHVRRVGVQVMIRPRGGNFVVSPHELAAMLADIAAIRALATHPDVAVGFVFGALTPERDVDAPTTARLMEACGPAPVTFHKAFDAARDLPISLDVLAGLGVHRVLTSGGASSATEGTAMLAELVRRSAGCPKILAGGGVRAPMVGALLAATGVTEVHLRAGGDIAAFMRAVRPAP